MLAALPVHWAIWLITPAGDRSKGPFNKMQEKRTDAYAQRAYAQRPLQRQVHLQISQFDPAELEFQEIDEIFVRIETNYPRCVGHEV